MDLQTEITLGHIYGVNFIASAGNGTDDKNSGRCSGGPSVGFDDGGNFNGSGTFLNGDHYPASNDYVISVSSVTGNDLFFKENNTNRYGIEPTSRNLVASAPFRNTSAVYNSHVDIVAPGADMITVLGTTASGGFDFNQGTSFSAPMVSGTIALMLSVNPCLTPNDIEYILKNSADDISAASSGSRTNASYLTTSNPLPSLPKRLNAGAAVAQAQSFGGQNITFSTNTTINGTTTPVYYLSGTMTIGSGVVVKFSGDVYIMMSSTAKIVVENGGKLVLDGVHLREFSDAYSGGIYCGMWQGITVKGDFINPMPSLSAAQSYTSAASLNGHGVLIVHNTHISNAYTAVTLGDGNFYAGGIILADNATFSNNQTAIKFTPYPLQPSSNSAWTNISHINNSVFDVDETLVPQMDCHIYLKAVHGVSITNSTFSSSIPSSFNGSGIRSVDAEYTATGNTLTGLIRGFEALGTGIATPNLLIQSNTLSGNLIGVIANATSNINILQNTITVNPWIGVGIYNQGNKSFGIEENTVTIPTNSSVFYNAGIYNIATSSIPNTIAKNTITGTGGYNYAGMPNSSGNSGLSFKCNVFHGDMDNISVLSNGIYSHQGTCSTRGTDGADNTFTTSCDANHPQLFANPNTDAFIYNYDPGFALNSACVIKPTYDNINPCHVSATGGVDGCGTRIIHGGGGISAMKTDIGTKTVAIAANHASLDNGRMQTYQYMVRNSSVTGNALLDTLKSTNGMVSDEVLLELLHRTPGVDRTKLSALLIQNAPHSNIVMNEILQPSMELPSDSVTKLIQYQDSTSPRKLIVDSIASLKAGKNDDYVLLTRYSMTDSSYHIHEVMDSLANETDIYLQLMLADLYMADSQYSAAKSIYDSLPAITKDIKNLKTLRNISYTFITNGWSWEDLADTSNHSAHAYSSQILAMATADTSIASFQAQVIRYIAYGDSIITVMEHKDTTGGGSYKMGSMEGIIPTIADSITNHFILYPNPADNRVVLDYAFDSDDNVFILYDLLGNVVKSQPLPQQKGKVELDISELSNGLYIYGLKHKETILKSGKLSVIK